MQYRSLSDMSQVITRNLHLIPSDVDLVVGIPRSGILPAITISLMRNLRYADLDRFLDGHLSGAGSTKQHAGLIADLREARHVLVVDDSLNRGQAMRKARERLGHLYKDIRFTFAAIYVVPDGRDDVDIAFEVISLPRIFEWNFIHHVYLEHAVVDIDGVLCCDPLDREADNERAYLRFIENAVPLYIPTRHIACLITARPEVYRQQTQAWLARQGITYDRLICTILLHVDRRFDRLMKRGSRGKSIATAKRCCSSKARMLRLLRSQASRASRSFRSKGTSWSIRAP